MKLIETKNKFLNKILVHNKDDFLRDTAIVAFSS